MCSTGPKSRNFSLLLGLSLVLLACVKAPLSPKEEFLRARIKLEESHNWCFGYGRPKVIEAELQNPGLPLEKRCELLRELSRYRLGLGNSEEALEVVNSALELAQENEDLIHLVPAIRAERAVVWLRLGELRNCVLAPTGSGCIFPLDSGGIHIDKEPAQNAFSDLLAYLNSTAKDSESEVLANRWLLNIVAMQLGQYPQIVPQEFRLVGQPGTASSEERFVDVAMGVGIKQRDLVGGIVLEDIDGDGLLDVLTSSGDFETPVRLYRNLGDGQFEDRTERAGLSDQVGAFNVRVADYDGDGDLDILLLRGAFLRTVGEIRNSLMRNNGDGTFSDVTHQAGLATPAHPTGAAAWGDFDGDGDLDLFVANESINQLNRGFLRPRPCQLFRNNGNGTFTDIAEKAGVDAVLYAKGVAAGDYDNDGDLDLFVSSFADWRLPPEQRRPSLLFRNEGDGTFREVAAEMGIDGPPIRGFGCWFFDYNNDGWLDLFVASYEAKDLSREVSHYFGMGHTPGQTRLFRNDQGKRFVNVSQAVGLAGTYSTMGCSFGDIDNDGYLDMYFGTGSVAYNYLVPNIMLRNVEGARFEDVTTSRGVGHLQKGHGIAFADVDHDGDQDIYVQLGGNLKGDAFANALFENPGNDNHFVHLKLVAPQPLGTRIRVDVNTPHGTRSFHRAVGCTSSFGYTPYRQEIGLGEATSIEQISVRWPSGEEQTFKSPPLDTMLELTRGKEEAVDLGLKPFTLKRLQRPPGEWCLPIESPKT